MRFHNHIPQLHTCMQVSPQYTEFMHLDNGDTCCHFHGHNVLQKEKESTMTGQWYILIILYLIQKILIILLQLEKHTKLVHLKQFDIVIFFSSYKYDTENWPLKSIRRGKRNCILCLAIHVVYGNHDVDWVTRSMRLVTVTTFKTCVVNMGIIWTHFTPLHMSAYCCTCIWIQPGHSVLPW